MDWVDLIKGYTPYNEQEKKDKEIILTCIEKFDDVLSRNNRIAHITSSAFVINEARDKMLMVHHNIYNSWSWTGGHADGKQDLLSVALRELKEETGVKNTQVVTSDIFSLDVLPVLAHIRKEEYVSAHLHLSVAFLVVADERDALIVKEDENSGIKWISIDEIDLYTDEPHMQKVYKKLISKIEK